jgi:hypothetical protein
VISLALHLNIFDQPVKLSSNNLIDEQHGGAESNHLHSLGHSTEHIVSRRKLKYQLYLLSVFVTNHTNNLPSN